MDVLLINAPVSFGAMAKGTAPPLGLAYIASFLKERGVNVGAIDMAYKEHSESEFKEFLLKYRPKIVGLGFTTHSRFQVVDVIKWIRETIMSAHITVGGHHVTNSPYDTLQNLDIDSAVIGDGEEAMYHLCCNVLNSDSSQVRGDEVPGLVLKSEVEKCDSSLSIGFVNDLDSCPWPDRDMFSSQEFKLIFPKASSVDAKNVEYIITSRGCPFACRFCSTHLTHGKKRIRFRNIVNVVDEIEFLINSRNCDGFFIYDDTFTLNNDRVKAFALEMKRRNIFVPFLCYSRVDTIRYDSLKLLHDVGLKAISFGIESGSPKILKYLNKNTTNHQAIEAVRICDEIGILAKGTFIVGSPHETIKDYMQTLGLISKLKKIQPDFVANIGGSGMFIYPGTGVFYDAIESGVLPPDFSWFKVYPEIEENYGVPVYFDSEIERLRLQVRIRKMGWMLIHDPKEVLLSLVKRTHELSRWIFKRLRKLQKFLFRQD